MDDQAHQLRRLVGDTARAALPGGGTGDIPIVADHFVVPAKTGTVPGPHLLVLTGGKGGVGTTTLAVNLAVAAAVRGTRTVLVDPQPRGEAAMLCGLDDRGRLAEVLLGRRHAHEVLQAGPAGIHLLSGSRPDEITVAPAHAAERLLDQLEALGPRADLVVLDAGNTAGAWPRRLWHAADLVVVVTTPETSAVLGAYAAMKTATRACALRAIHLLVNLAARSAAADDVSGRLSEAGRRFLGIDVCTLGRVPPDPRVAAATEAAVPFVLSAAGGEAAEHVGAAAERIAACVDLRERAAQRRSEEGAGACASIPPAASRSVLD